MHSETLDPEHQKVPISLASDQPSFLINPVEGRLQRVCLVEHTHDLNLVDGI